MLRVAMNKSVPDLYGYRYCSLSYLSRAFLSVLFFPFYNVHDPLIRNPVQNMNDLALNDGLESNGNTTSASSSSTPAHVSWECA